VTFSPDSKKPPNLSGAATTLKDTSSASSPNDAKEGQEMNKQDIKKFEKEYAKKLDQEGLESAKAHFRANFAVRCFHCGHTGPTRPPLNCARCGAYLD